MTPLVANIGGWIGRELARGEPIAIAKAIAVLVGVIATYRLLAWWRTQ